MFPVLVILLSRVWDPLNPAFPALLSWTLQMMNCVTVKQARSRTNWSKCQVPLVMSRSPKRRKWGSCREVSGIAVPLINVYLPPEHPAWAPDGCGRVLGTQTLGCSYFRNCHCFQKDDGTLGGRSLWDARPGLDQWAKLSAKVLKSN